MTTWSQVTWEAARAGGFVSYALLSGAVAIGLVLGARRQSPRWPRVVTNELHGYLSLLALVFVALHVLAVAVDPFTHFGLAEVLVPLASHYRPIWMGLGVVSLYLLLAVWASTKLRQRIGYGAWRRIHLLAFAIYAAATVHGLGTGSDTRTLWGIGIYLASVGTVGSLLVLRLLRPAGGARTTRPGLAALTGAATLLVAIWAAAGPLAAHWGARAGGARPTRVAAPVATPRPGVAHAVASRVDPPFAARFRGLVSVSSVNDAGRLTVRIDGALSGPTRDHLEILLHGVPLEDGGVAMERSRVLMGAQTALYQGEVTRLEGRRLIADVRSPRQQLRLSIDLRLDRQGHALGTVRGTSARAGAGSPQAAAGSGVVAGA